MSRRTGFILACLLTLGPVPAVAAREIHVPLNLDHEYLRRALLERVFTGPDATAPVWQDADGCNRLTLAEPAVDSADGRIRVRSKARAIAGAPLGSSCLTLLDWSGSIEVFEEASVAPDLPIIHFKVVDSNVYGKDLQKTASGKIWDWVKAYVHPRLEALTVDLHQPLTELKTVLPLFLARPDAERTTRLIDSLGFGGVKVVDPGLEVDLRFELADATPGPDVTPSPEPTLTVDELVQWQESWHRWDAFLTFVLKHVARDTLDPEQRRALLEVLLDARYQLADALTSADTRRDDPVRRLFLSAWTELAPVLRQLGTGLPGEKAVQYLSFIAAADALGAIDQLEPETGIDISADGLRRLARVIAPASTEDPLLYTLDVDQDLRDLFGFGPAPEPPEPTPEAGLTFWFRTAAWAGADPTSAMVGRLRRWVPKREDVKEYLPLVRDLLRFTTEGALDTASIDERFRPIYRWLVLATAWQESCWRQFIEQNGVLRPLTSVSGSVGLMQVNTHVWRGFYALESLRQDIGYNARAGSEILARYMDDYAIAKREHETTGDVDSLARATYAVYNAGPGSLRRYRTASTRKSLKRIDESFWKKYREVKAGRELGVAECYGY